MHYSLLIIYRYVFPTTSNYILLLARCFIQSKVPFNANFKTSKINEIKEYAPRLSKTLWTLSYCFCESYKCRFSRSETEDKYIYLFVWNYVEIYGHMIYKKIIDVLYKYKLTLKFNSPKQIIGWDGAKERTITIHKL